MTGREEAKKIAKVWEILGAMPVDARLRALAFLTSKALDVGGWIGSDILYKHASLARAEQQASEAPSPTAKDE